MSKTAILVVDDDPQVLAAVARDIRQRYGQEHRILRTTSGAEALSTLNDLKARGDKAAVLIADQRMPAMTGTEFLSQAQEIFPDAKTVLLTAYADTSAAISAINEVHLNHYLLKPWDPPEEHLYPIIDELLEEWVAGNPRPFDGIMVLSTRWSPTTHVVKDFLARNRIPYRFFDVETEPEARAVLEAGETDMPLVILPEGTRLNQPDIRTLAAAVGLQTEAKSPFYDLVIVGAGPSGLGAAVYGASEGLRTALVERAATGGQAGTSSLIENYLGFPSGISGGDLATRATTQALKFGAEVLTGPEVVGVEVVDPVKTVVLSDGQRLSCHALIVASGMTIRRLGVESVEALVGAGVFYGAAPSEAASYKDEPVYVVGGANSAGQAAMMLSRYASHVTVLVRGPNIESGMSTYLINQLKATSNIDIRLSSEVVDAGGERHLEWIVIGDRQTGEQDRVDTNGLFLFIGALPHSDFVDGVVARNARGFIKTGPDLRVEGAWPADWPLERDPLPMETSVPGIFAAGDVREGVVRRVASAVGQGAIAVSLVHQYLETV
ncbi:MAG TPA: FAD-dependent oxidoreductase [Acidimicrobiia bacterium]|nr:FAD-dependent oxidoreductase [Acidimicrobiia bacterium]